MNTWFTWVSIRYLFLACKDTKKNHLSKFSSTINTIKSTLLLKKHFLCNLWYFLYKITFRFTTNQAEPTIMNIHCIMQIALINLPVV